MRRATEYKDVLFRPRNTRPLQPDDGHCSGLSYDQVRHTTHTHTLPPRLLTMKSITTVPATFYEPRTKHASPSDLPRQYTAYHEHAFKIAQCANTHAVYSKLLSATDF